MFVEAARGADSGSETTVTRRRELEMVRGWRGEGGEGEAGSGRGEGEVCE